MRVAMRGRDLDDRGRVYHGVKRCGVAFKRIDDHGDITWKRWIGVVSDGPLWPGLDGYWRRVASEDLVATLESEWQEILSRLVEVLS